MGKVQERLAWWRPRRVCDAATADGAGHRLLDVSSWSVQTGDKSWGATNIETQARRLDKATQEFRRGQAKAEQWGPRAFSGQAGEAGVTIVTLGQVGRGRFWAALPPLPGASLRPPGLQWAVTL